MIQQTAIDAFRQAFLRAGGPIGAGDDAIRAGLEAVNTSPQPLPLAVGRIHSYCGRIDRPHTGHVWVSESARWCPGDEVHGRSEPRIVATAPSFSTEVRDA